MLKLVQIKDYESENEMKKISKNLTLGFFSIFNVVIPTAYAANENLQTSSVLEINASVLPECKFTLPEVIIFDNISSADVKNHNTEDRVSGFKSFEVNASCPGVSKINLEIIPKFTSGKCIATTRESNESVTDDILRFCLQTDGELVDFSESNVIYSFKESTLKKEFLVSINLGSDNNIDNVIGTYQGYIDIRFTPD
ncbi:hypothetical protein ACBQ24_16080 [Acinetobacter terrestris]|uniref:hypothetical protein n=1 Tax=Acinetobacter terrestris TaxID=2529843 RepID=UPI00352605B7